MARMWTEREWVDDLLSPLAKRTKRESAAAKEILVLRANLRHAKSVLRACSRENEHLKPENKRLWDENKRLTAAKELEKP